MSQASAPEATPREAIENCLMTFLKDTLNIDIDSSDQNLIETGLLDSLMLVDLVLHIERNFNVLPSLEDLAIENFATISHMADFVAARELGSASAVATTAEVVPELDC